jgi:hypothetical protein
MVFMEAIAPELSLEFGTGVGNLRGFALGLHHHFENPGWKASSSARRKMVAFGS